MKAAKICLVILLVSIVINFARQGNDFHISNVLPGLGGDPIGLYDIAGLALLALLIRGIIRMKRNAERRDREKMTPYDDNNSKRQNNHY